MSYSSMTERLVYLLAFLFPIAGMSIAGWLSNTFNILVLISLIMLHKKGDTLLKQEKIFLWICLAYFSMFIVSGVGNGWGPVQTHELGTETRFLFAIPLYLLVRRYPDCTSWLIKGGILGSFIIFAQAYHDVYISDRTFAWGVYSKNIIGPFAVLISFWSLYYLIQNRKRLHWIMSVFILLSIAAAIFSAGISGSRGGYIGFIITGLVSILFFTRPRWMFVSIGVMGAVLFVTDHYIGTVSRGVDAAFIATKQYLQAENHVTDKSSFTSTGTRLEMLRTGILFLKDNPIIGIGPGNYKKNAEIYIKEGKASSVIAEHSYPHNAFLEVATAKGLLGLVTILLLFYYPAYIYIRDYKKCKPTAVIGLIHIIALSSFALTDHSVVVMNNYTSILLLGTVIFFSAHMRCRRKKIDHG